MTEGSWASDGFPSEVRVRCGEGRCMVGLLVIVTADGLVAYLCGGERSHLGAMVFSLPRPSLVDKGRISCDSAVLPRPGHKDDVVAKALAEQLSKALDVAVCVVAGIHTESALPSELETIVENCSEAGSQVILAIQSAQFDLVRQGG